MKTHTQLLNILSMYAYAACCYINMSLVVVLCCCCVLTLLCFSFHTHILLFTAVQYMFLPGPSYPAQRHKMALYPLQRKQQRPKWITPPLPMCLVPPQQQLPMAASRRQPLWHRLQQHQPWRG